MYFASAKHTFIWFNHNSGVLCHNADFFNAFVVLTSSFISSLWMYFVLGNQFNSIGEQLVGLGNNFIAWGDHFDDVGDAFNDVGDFFLV